MNLKVLETEPPLAYRHYTVLITCCMVIIIVCNVMMHLSPTDLTWPSKYVPVVAVSLNISLVVIAQLLTTVVLFLQLLYQLS